MTDSDNNQTSTTEDFINVLDDLADFKIYFTDEEQSATLINWLIKDWGISKFKARLLVKRIAPFVIARLGDAGKVIGDSAKRKLHGYFNKFDWYFNLTQKLLNLLKTKNDKTFENTLAKPKKKELKLLVEDSKLWESLKPEYQGLVQLLLGQKELLEGLDFLHQQLSEQNQQLSQQIIEELSFSLNLESPTQTAAKIDKSSESLANWLTYTHRQIPLVGRDASLQLLDDFFDQDSNFSWWLITGAGGMGKSRLAFEALINRDNTWEVGFLPKAKLNDPDALSHWQPKKPTIIVIDYAAEYPEQIGTWLDHFINHQDGHQNGYQNPVRLLILERESKEQEWWKQLLAVGSKDSEFRLNTLHTQSPHELLPLNNIEQKQALQAFLISLKSEVELPVDNDTFWGKFDELSNQGRPLFIGMVAIAIANEGVNQIRNWDQQDLLQHVLAHEQNNWKAHYKAEEQELVYDFLALSCVIGGFKDQKTNKLMNGLLKNELLEKKRGYDARWQLIQTLSGNPQGQLQPDIFAEYFVLQQWQVKNGDLPQNVKEVWKLAYKLAPENTLAFISRSAVDYPNNKSAWYWWFELQNTFTYKKKKKIAIHQGVFNQTAFEIIDKLSLYGYPAVALNRWLPVLCESYDLETKARALNFKGMQLQYLGKLSHALTIYKQSLEIKQETGDKQGEDMTLNNISQIYHNQGDHKTALIYLNKSLEIQQEIGNKFGEGKTLNNISLIYLARRDYETALSYLNRSLDIKQEISDKLGEGKTLSNISQIYDAQGDYKTAFQYLNQSLEIQQEVGDKFGEGTTFNNMATIAHAQGNYETALSYLNQSLKIAQKIGSKSSEGTTFNNMSAIAYEQGNDKDALNYLKQSLEIRQEIGDISGFCVSSINMGQMHWQNNKHDLAMKTWGNAYVLAESKGFAQALEALESMAEQFEFSDGVKGWEKFVDKP